METEKEIEDVVNKYIELNSRKFEEDSRKWI